jgi:hypothetical protein
VAVSLSDYLSKQQNWSTTRGASAGCASGSGSDASGVCSGSALVDGCHIGSDDGTLGALLLLLLLLLLLGNIEALVVGEETE